MKETTVSRLLEYPRRNFGDMFHKESIEEVLVGSYFLDNLSIKEIKKLKINREPIRKRVILDYLKAYGGGDVIDRFLANKDKCPETLTDCVLELDLGVKQENKTRLTTPEKQITFLAYLSFLENAASEELTERSTSKEDLKRVYYFDYIYNFLNEGRKNLIDCDGNVSDAVLGIAKLYKGQILAEKIKKQNGNLESLLSKIESSDILIADILRLRESEREVSNYQPISNGDSEVVNLLERSKNLLSKGKVLIERKINSKFDEEYPNFERTFEELSNKDVLKDEDMRRLSQTHLEAKKLLELLDYVGNTKRTETYNLFTNISRIIKNYNEFERKKKGFEFSLADLSAGVDKTLSLSPRSYFMGRPKWKSIEQVLSFVGKLSNLKREVEESEKNKYFFKYVDAYRETIDKYTNTLSSKIEEALRILKETEERYRFIIEGYGNSFFRFLIVPRANKRLERVKSYIKEFEEKSKVLLNHA